MASWILPTNQALQTKVVSEADENTLILTSGGRLARQLRHAFRLEQVQKGRSSWLPPKVLSLNAWIGDTWRSFWPEELPVSPLRVLKFFEEAVQKIGLPEGLTADILLYRSLEETYQVRIRNKIPPIRNGYAHPLILWREEIFRHFEQDLIGLGLIHPAELPLKVLQGLLSGIAPLSKTILLIGFEFPAPIESDLLSVLIKKYGAVSCGSQPVREPMLSAISFPNQEEEAVWISEQVLLAAQKIPLHRIAIVAPNLSHYGPIFSDSFRELIGPSVTEGKGSYNISLGRPLGDQPLTQAGLLPLRFFLEGESRTLLFSWLLSPYYRLWGSYRSQIAQADYFWRKRAIDSGLEALLQSLVDIKPEGPSFQIAFRQTFETLRRILHQGRQSGVRWVEALLQCWQLLGFPVLTLAGEEGFYRHLKEILNILKEDFQSILMDISEFFSWLKYLLNETLVNEPGYEQAGFQILGLIEARGLAFDRLFLAGLSKGSLPQPVRPFPFLSPEERGMVQGASIKSQYAFARHAFSHLKTTSPEMNLTRPDEEKGNPVPPSPFWPKDAEKRERNYWIVPGPAWIRTEWLKQTAQGIKNYPRAYPPEKIPLERLPLPETVAVTAVETALSCPFKFFCEQLLKVAPLDEIVIGVSSREKGEALHAILALITKKIRSQKISIKAEENLSGIVKQSVQEVLKTKNQDPHWLIEQKRLIGEDEAVKGLLGAWLDEERKRWEQGWRWEEEEFVFSKLRLPSCSFFIHGRIDRIDCHPSFEQVCCLDYKTGALPSAAEISKRYLAPQLPLYLLAINNNPGFKEKSLKGLRAAYLSLKSQGETAIKEPLDSASAWEVCLTDWEREITALGERLSTGIFPADPRPEPLGRNQGACSYCPYGSLCLYWKIHEN